MKALLSLGIILAFVFGAHAHAQTSLTFKARSRPVLRAALALTAKYGYVITYEEPIYTDPDDLKDVTAQHNAPPHSTRRILIPRGGDVQLPLPAGGSVNQETMYVLLQTLLQSWNASNQGGAHFAVKEDGAVFHIVPTEVRDADGNWQPVTSILYEPLSFANAVGTRDQTLQRICDAIRVGIRVNCLPDGAVIVGPPQTQQYRLAAYAEPGESVLTRALKTMGKNSWYLLYDPTEHAYYMNIIREPEPLSTEKAPSPSRTSPARVTLPNCVVCAGH